MSGKYPKLKDYEGFFVNHKKGDRIYFACCDCGMVHCMGFAEERADGGKESKGHLGVAFRSEPRRTAQLRRHRFGNLQQGRGMYRLVRRRRSAQ